jgi:hypothetical protein
MIPQNPGEHPTTHPSLLFFGAIVIAVTIVAIIALFNALNRGPLERTSAGPGHHAVSS